jgi:hypothetical protein
VQSGSELVPRIDRMIKTCYERLHYGTQLGTDAAFEAYYTIQSNSLGNIVLDTDDVAMLATSFNAVEDSIRLSASPISMLVEKSTGTGYSTIELGSAVQDTLKYSIEHFSPSINMAASVDGTSKKSFLSQRAGVELSAAMTDLCYRFYTASIATVQMAAAVLGTEIHYSLGSGSDSFVIDADIGDGECVAKYESTENKVKLLVELIESIRQFMMPNDAGVQFNIEASSIIKRRRLLLEMDEDALSSYDDMSLDEADYIIL